MARGAKARTQCANLFDSRLLTYYGDRGSRCGADGGAGCKSLDGSPPGPDQPMSGRRKKMGGEILDDFFWDFGGW